MIRKFGLLVAMVVAAFAFTASSASAQVHVENDGTHDLINEVSLSVVAHIGGGVEVPTLACDNDWELIIDEAGNFEVEVHDILTHGGQTGACNTWTPCDPADPQNHANGSHWPGRIFETAPEFRAHLTFCLAETGGPLDNVPISIECAVTDTEMHCDEVIAPGEYTPTHPQIEIQGEATVEDLGLMHGPN